MLSFAALLLLTQPSAEAAAPQPGPVVDARLEVCLDKARADPATAISEASQWLGESTGAQVSDPQQCLGMAYTALLRWEAAEQAFRAARDAQPADAHFRRAQLGAMAGNAALAEDRAVPALIALDLAAQDAAASGDTALHAIIEVDRARALVAQQDEAGAADALELARTLDPQSPYALLLSATLARRQGDLTQAQAFIQTAAELAPDYPETGLEAGVIAMLDGREQAARASWQSVIDTDPASEAAAIARDYLAQLGDPIPGAPARANASEGR